MSTVTTKSFILLAACLASTLVAAQTLTVKDGMISSIQWGGKTHDLNRPLVSFMINEDWSSSVKSSAVTVTWEASKDKRAAGVVVFRNTSRDTIRLHNIVPFAPDPADVYMTGKGKHRLSRTHLFRPGRIPVNVIVPDNAWELGYAAVTLADGGNAFGLTRRDENSITKGTRKRFETILAPGGSVAYWLYAETYSGSWQQGVRICFQDRMLYDLETFDNSMYERPDLSWIRKAYVMHLMAAWDKDYYDMATGQFNWKKFVQHGKSLYGGDDVICLWPTWPTLGMDERNQFDMYRDLPGGMPALRAQADTLRKYGAKFFIAYNPWDESTRKEGHLQGLAYLIKETSADGVVLDTKGESSRELQQAADKVKPGVIMYSEGMAVPKDMPGIVSGRVHDALVYPPMLNLNKLIRPDFAIFRVALVFKEPIRREYATAFFNGYGTEINQFMPGHPEYEDEQYKFLGRTTMILRENSDNFLSRDFVPLTESKPDSIWVNRWPAGRKTLYTAFSLKPGGYRGQLFEVQDRKDHHWVDLWHHEPLSLVQHEGKAFVHCNIDAFNISDLGTNNEGAVICIAELPEMLSSTIKDTFLEVDAREGSSIRIWAGLPDYGRKPLELKPGKHTVDIWKEWDRYEGKIVVQLMDGTTLLDENVLMVKPGEARLVSVPKKTAPMKQAPAGMIRIPAGRFTMKTTHGEGTIPYPHDSQEASDMPSLFMDKFPVTNSDFKLFLDKTGYRPSDTTNFLKHWKNGKIPAGQERFPVVYISLEDANAYAAWAGKRLPTEREWQYAAQTEKMNEWPWPQPAPVKRKEQWVTENLTVSTLEGIDKRNCNLGDGKPYAVGKFPRGANPFGLQDLVGCVWQLTNDVYENGSYRYIMMKGGSYFKPSSSWWYVQGGPRELHYRQYLLRVSPGFERNSTVGFRCFADY